MTRPTEDDLIDDAETGRAGCLIPQLDDPPEVGSDDEEEDDE